VLAIKTDGGPDRNPQYASVQLAYTALSVLLGIPKLVVMRTAAGHSFTNPVERVMSVINQGLQGVTTARGRCEPHTEAVLQNCNSMKDMRKALQQADGARRVHTHRDLQRPCKKLCKQFRMLAGT
jgi:hypothetical protein